jgi:hypothetical protein
VHYCFTATFGDFSVTTCAPLQISALADYWMLLVDRSATMANGTPVKRTNATITAQVWADVISAFRFSSTSPDRIGLIDFSDPSPGGFRASPAASVDVGWPAPSAMGPLKAITDPNQDKFKVAGTSVLGAPADQTPLGDALVKALDMMAATSGGNADFRYHVLVVTDGVENTGTVMIDPASPLGGASTAQTFDSVKSSGARSIFDYTSTGNVRIYPVGTGFSTATNTTVLNSLGSYGPGPYSMTSSVRDLFPTAFGTDLFTALGASPQNVSQTPPVNTDPSPVAGANMNVYFAVPNNEAKLVVVVMWDNSANTNVLDLRFRPQQQPSPPNPFQAVTPAAALTVAARDTHVVAVVDVAQITTAATEWRITFTSGGNPHTILVTDVLSGRDLHVRTAITFDRAAYYSDEPMVVTASAHAGGRPIADARVDVELEGPALSEGELLASNSRLAMSSKGLPLDPDGLHPGSREAFLGRILAGKQLSSLPTVQYTSCLFTDGSRALVPDREGGPGYFTNVFGKNWREGTYNFRFTITGKTPDGAVFSDVHSVSRQVKLRTEDAFSTIAVTEGLAGPMPGLRSARIRVTPKDALGQRLGPFRAAEVQFQTTRGAFVDEVESDYDGSYSQILVYPGKQIPVVTVQVQGRAFAPIVLSRGLSGAVTSIVRRVLAWLVRSARHR